MTDNEPFKKLPVSGYLKIALYIVLGVATLCLAGGYMGWIASGGLFFLGAVPLFISYLIAKGVESSRANANNPTSLTDEQRTELSARGTAKAIMGIIVLAIPFGILISKPWDNEMAAGVGSIFCWIFMLFSLWPILGGVVDLRKSIK